MNNENFNISFNSAETDCNIEKRKISKIGAMSSALVLLFVGGMAIKPAFDGNIVLGNDFTTTSCIQYVNLEKECRLDNLFNNQSIDLLKLTNLEKIQKMALFEEDWNGTGGKAFSKSAIELFRQVVDSLKKQPQIAPTGRNSMLLQYELGNKSLLAFEVSVEKLEKVCVINGQYDMAEIDIYTENFEQMINESVERFYGLN